MSVFRYGEKRPEPKSWFKRLVVFAFVSILLTASLFFGWFYVNTQAVNKEGNREEEITVISGASEASISQLLEDKGLIRSSLAYQAYTTLYRNGGQAKAGSYTLSTAMSVGDIVNKLSKGDITVDLITILPAQRIAQLREYFIDEGYFEAEVDDALNPDKYKGHPALADKPALASLEGYISPESFQYTAQTPLSSIIESSLDITASMFTTSVKQGLAEQGLDMHEAIILASIVEKEVSNLDDKPTVAQVFLTRLERGITLGSDVTAYYGASLIGVDEAVSVDTAYNTRIYAGLPPGPISNISASSLQAVADPSETDFLFFVAGDDGVTYFSNTVQEHEQLIDLHCKILCLLP